MAIRRRRVHEEEPGADRRPHAAREREDGGGGRAEGVLRLQKLAGNRAVGALMRSPAVQREEATAPAPAEAKPKESGIEVIVEDERIGSFLALSTQFVTGSSSSAEARERTNEIVITKRTDEDSPLLMQAAANGTLFPTVTIAFPGLPFVMKDVVLTSFSMGGGHEAFDSMVFSGTKPQK
jgi:hypothetical protein